VGTSATTEITASRPIPGFATPRGRRLDPALPEVQAADPETSQPDSLPPADHPTTDLSGQYVPTAPRLDASDRTQTSTPGKAPKPSAAETARLVAGLLGLAVAGAAVLVRWRRRDLRRPAKDQLDDVAAPIARILMRHVDPALLSPDLADAAMAGAALGAYLTDGPLLLPLPVDAGVPSELPDPEEL
jgi:hypothetical protein